MVVAAESGWKPAPYAPDEHTLHLWHLDEKVAPFQDQASPATPLLGLLNGAKAGRPSLPGFGSSVSFHHAAGGHGRMLQGAVLLAAPSLANGPQDRVPEPFAFTGPDGAFTFEALVKLKVPPSEALGDSLAIVTMDGEGGERVFQWYVSPNGFLVFVPINSVAAAGGAIATIPTTGPDAINTEDWFHVAVSYTGHEGADNNLALYWTRLRPGLTEANLIGQGTMPADLLDLCGDFAIGNEARGTSSNAEASPFAGLIDEVRLSDRARHPTDFLFVPPERRNTDPAGGENLAIPMEGQLGIRLLELAVDGNTTPLPGPRETLELEAGLHRLDFEFQVEPPGLEASPRIRWHLDGLDRDWEEQGQGMVLRVEVLGADSEILSQTSFPALGASERWDTSLDGSEYTQRSEPIMLEPGAHALRMVFDSGAADATGECLIDDLNVRYRPVGGETRSLWFNSNFSEGVHLMAPHGTPSGWQRRGSNRSIARPYTFGGGLGNIGLALIDGSQSSAAAWVAEALLPDNVPSGAIVMLEWRELYNVIGGKTRRAGYLNVSPGSYSFRAIAALPDGSATSKLSVPIVIKAPFWTRPLYWGLVSTLAAALVAGIIISLYRRRNRLRMRALRLKNALAEDRARIARDMHDDLGTRISVLTMSGALVRRHFETDPATSLAHLDRMDAAARNLVAAMDDLVWSVDPSNDTLEDFGNFLARCAQEIFGQSPIQCRLDLPADLPEVTLHSELRHHLSLMVKECCNNILRHAGPCEAKIKLRYQSESGRLTIEISDTGCGFDPGAPRDGNGLDNMRRRIEEVAGAIEFASLEGQGTKVLVQVDV